MENKYFYYDMKGKGQEKIRKIKKNRGKGLWRTNI